MRLDGALRDVGEAEARLGRALRNVAERHRDERDLRHLSEVLATWSDEHVGLLGEHAARYGVRETVWLPRFGRAPDESAPDGLTLLRDLRQLHMLASDASVAWLILGHGAAGARDRELTALVARCQPETVRVMKWLLARIKATAPQILSS